ncbi:MAG TPA: LCP family protein [Candidatus Limnocylindria bacterium]|nr:LCP family protein [Candidatus Limnocylindria bacterium]
MQRTPAVIIGIAVLVAAAVIGFLLLSPPAAAPGGGPAQASSTTEPSASASVDAALTDKRWTVLYVGTDLNEEREANGQTPNADALMLVSLSADQSQLTLVSLPRDTVDLPLADGGTYEHKINALYAEQGIDALVGAMEALYGIEIDAHVVLDMDDVVSLIEAVGGVDVSPAQPLTDPIVNLDLEAGPQTLDAPTAMGYVRTRVDQDYGRMARQQEVLMALVARLVDPEADVDLRGLLDGLDSLDTDLPLDDLPTLVELARRATQAEVKEIVIQPPLITFEGDRGDGRGYVLEPDVEAIREAVQEAIGE